MRNSTEFGEALRALVTAMREELDFSLEETRLELGDLPCT